MALPLNVRQRIFRELSRGKTQRSTAKKIGVSRGTVTAIAKRGKPELYLDCLSDGKNDSEIKTCSPYRCPGCGHMVYFVVCRICTTRSIRPAAQGVNDYELPPRDEDPTIKMIDETKKSLRDKRMKEYSQETEDRWYPPTFATPVYSLVEAEGEID